MQRQQQRSIRILSIEVVTALMIVATSALAQTRTSQPAPAKQWTQLFNGKDLSGFHTFIDKTGAGKDPEGYFKVEDGMIHILGLPTTDATKPFGYLITEQEFGDFHLRVQQKWGEKKFAPRTTQPRDSGVLYLMHGGDKLWPNSIECQVQEGDTGEMIIVGKTLKIDVPVKMDRNRKVFTPGAPTTNVTEGRVYKNPQPDSKTDWNTIEVIVKGNSAVHIVNGVVIMYLPNIRLIEGDKPLTKGRILLQAEGSEVFYRNVEIRPLAPNESLPQPTPIAG